MRARAGGPRDRRHGRRLGRVLPVPRRGRGGRGGRRARRRPARRQRARRRGHRGGRTSAASRWSSPARATSGTEARCGSSSSAAAGASTRCSGSCAQSPRVHRRSSARRATPASAELAEIVPIAADDVAGLVALRAARGDRPHRRRARAAAHRSASSTRFEAAGLRVFGPTGAPRAARGQQGVRQGRCSRASASRPRVSRPSTSATRRARYVDEVGAPVVVKADGLAAGKGVLVCDDRAEARAGARRDHGRRASSATPARASSIEEFLDGEEVSFMALTDGTDGRAARVVAGPQAGRRRRHRARTPAAWARTRRRRSSTPALERRGHGRRSCARSSRGSRATASSTAACSTPAS